MGNGGKGNGRKRSEKGWQRQRTLEGAHDAAGQRLAVADQAGRFGEPPHGARPVEHDGAVAVRGEPGVAVFVQPQRTMRVARQVDSAVVEQGRRAGAWRGCGPRWRPGRSGRDRPRRRRSGRARPSRATVRRSAHRPRPGRGPSRAGHPRRAGAAAGARFRPGAGSARPRSARRAAPEPPAAGPGAPRIPQTHFRGLREPKEGLTPSHAPRMLSPKRTNRELMRKTQVLNYRSLRGAGQGVFLAAIPGPGSACGFGQPAGQTGGRRR